MQEVDLAAILAIDLGLRTGVAVWDDTARLRTWQTIRFRSPRALQQGVRTVVRDLDDDVVFAVTEGDLDLARPWDRALTARGIRVLHVQAHQWRRDVFADQPDLDGKAAKRAALALARRLIREHAARGVPHLKHDAAEAICLGYWAAWREGW